MAMRRTLVAAAALAAVATAALATVNAAQADDTATVIDVKKSNVSLSEVRYLIAKNLKEETDLPTSVAIASAGKAVPSSKQLSVLLSGKTADEHSLFLLTDKVGSDSTIGGLVEGTPLPAVVAYRVNRQRAAGMTHEVLIRCAEYCRIYVRDYNIP